MSATLSAAVVADLQQKYTRLRREADEATRRAARALMLLHDAQREALRNGLDLRAPHRAAPVPGQRAETYVAGGSAEGPSVPVAAPAQNFDAWARVFSACGQLTHLAFSTEHNTLCGRVAPLGGWRGTGSQAEYERADQLTLCPVCDHAAGAR